jgi:hypothetical protein
MYSFRRHALRFLDSYNIFHLTIFMTLLLIEHSYVLQLVFVFFIGVLIRFINNHVENGIGDLTEHV